MWFSLKNLHFTSQDSDNEMHENLKHTLSKLSFFIDGFYMFDCPWIVGCV